MSSVSKRRPRWRGKQSPSDLAEQQSWATRLGVGMFDCRLCGWTMAEDGQGYDTLMSVCCQCAFRLMNIYERRHSGRWFYAPSALPEDREYFGELNVPLEILMAPPPAPKKAKISNAIRLKVYERDGYKCVYCGKKKELSLDHVTAESKGGATSAGNLVTACKPCNSKKRTKSLVDFWETRA